ncbi:MAG: oligosaccharide flippase family protein [Candidatus Aminicenantes bacterium]|nr:MAG: oligosaccharide flippase family protein [Candidatus Aminicenantes bacterium]
MEITQKFKNSVRFFAGESLTKKASLNALTVALDYGARLLVGFVITPFMVLGLGQYFFGTWQVLNRMVSYISPSSGRPTQALKWTIARDQTSNDYVQKQQFVGSAIIVWIIFLPLMILLGGILVWQLPYWLKAAPEHFLPIRLCSGILVANLALTGLTHIPSSVLQGENLGYKRMGLTTSTVLLGGGLVWLALHLGMGIVGVAAAAMTTTVLTGTVFLLIVRRNTPWFKISFPPFRQTRKFFVLSSWFLGWNLVMKLMTASDVVILGFLKSVESVTDYTLLKYAPETLISLIALTNLGIAPGLGGIIGSGQLKKAANIRGEMLSITWLVTTALGASILVWNRTFLVLWVGPGHYVGPFAAFFITLVVTQFVVIRSDVGIIDLSLDLRSKVLLGLLSAAAAIVLASLLVGYFDLGVIGICIGLIMGRFVLSVGYPSIIGRLLGLSIFSQLRSSLRPALVTILLYLFATWIQSYMHLGDESGLLRWVYFVLGAGITAGVFLAAAFYSGLSGRQRKIITGRLRSVYSPESRQERT